MLQECCCVASSGDWLGDSPVATGRIGKMHACGGMFDIRLWGLIRIFGGFDIRFGKLIRIFLLHVVRVASVVYFGMFYFLFVGSVGVCVRFCFGHVSGRRVFLIF